jgi:hypothetical protein
MKKTFSSGFCVHEKEDEWSNFTDGLTDAKIGKFCFCIKYIYIHKFKILNLNFPLFKPEMKLGWQKRLTPLMDTKLRRKYFVSINTIKQI